MTTISGSEGPDSLLDRLGNDGVIPEGEDGSPGCEGRRWRWGAEARESVAFGYPQHRP